jgi:hypothetical protein
MKTHLSERRYQILRYFPADNNEAGKKRVLNTFNENIIVAAKMKVNIHDKLTESLADKTLQLEFSSKELDKF